MLSSVVSFVKAVVASVVLAVNTVVIFSSMIPFALLKLALPFQAVRRVTDFVLNRLASGWIAVNGVWMAAVGRTRWQVSGMEGFSPRGWYLVSSNHQSWVDIPVLQRTPAVLRALLAGLHFQRHPVELISQLRIRKANFVADPGDGLIKRQPRAEHNAQHQTDPP